jgi:hypothetical protein
MSQDASKEVQELTREHKNHVRILDFMKDIEHRQIIDVFLGILNTRKFSGVTPQNSRLSTSVYNLRYDGSCLQRGLVEPGCSVLPLYIIRHLQLPSNGSPCRSVARDQPYRDLSTGLNAGYPQEMWKTHLRVSVCHRRAILL